MMTDTPASRGARFDVLQPGSLRPRVRSTVTLVREGGLVAVVDPGLAPSPAAILEPLAALGLSAEAVTTVILSHHHPDHTLNAALFPNAEVHDHWAVYRGDEWDSRECEGAQLSSSVRLIRTPGHAAEELSTVVGTAEGIVVATHLWWTAEGPADDPYAPDREQLRRSRERVLAIADVIVPGHGAPFRPGAATPR
jgi:glyoxylase-like metal-dependent hydrolase (beta-lactamase superfamily II)